MLMNERRGGSVRGAGACGYAQPLVPAGVDGMWSREPASLLF